MYPRRTWALSQYKDGLSNYRDFHYEDKTVIFIIGIPILVRRYLYTETVPWTCPPLILRMGVSPMFTRPYVTQSLCSPFYDISLYVSHIPQSLCSPFYDISLYVSHIPQSLCSPFYYISLYVSHIPQSLCSPERFPGPVAPHPYITQSLFSPVTVFPIIPSHSVSQSLCSTVPTLFSPYAPQALCSPVPLKHSSDVSQISLEVPIFQQTLTQSHIFTDSIFPSSFFLIPMFSEDDPQSWCLPVLGLQ